MFPSHDRGGNAGIRVHGETIPRIVGRIMGTWNMTIEVVSMEEHEDGSATLQVDMDEETKEYLINLGFETLIRKAMEHEHMALSTNKTHLP